MHDTLHFGEEGRGGDDRSRLLGQLQSASMPVLLCLQALIFHNDLIYILHVSYIGDLCRSKHASKVSIRRFQKSNACAKCHQDTLNTSLHRYPIRPSNHRLEQKHCPGGNILWSIRTSKLGKLSTRFALLFSLPHKQFYIAGQEFPIVAALDMDLQLAGTHCTHCLRTIEANMAITDDASVLPSKYCSKVCLLASKSRSSSLLFTVEPPLPPEIPAPPMPPVAIESRRAAQTKFVDYLKKDAHASPLLVARFIARQVAVETNKMVSAAGKKTPAESDDFTDAETDEYVLADHIERWRYLEMKAPEEEHALLVEILQFALPGLEQFITDERHATLLGKVVYNSYGVCFNGGRDDKVRH